MLIDILKKMEHDSKGVRGCQVVRFTMVDKGDEMLKTWQRLGNCKATSAKKCLLH